MNILEVELEKWNIIIFRFNWIVILILFLIIVAVIHFSGKSVKFWHRGSITIDEISLGIGNNNFKFSYNKKDQEIAYKLWVELSTRKIGIAFDENNDVIKEVYDSWYEFFKIARELLKEVPVNRMPYSDKLINLTEKVLNKGLRPHLTIWQAKFRKWYDRALNENDDLSPQEIQKMYPEYKSLVEDLVKTNTQMIKYKNLMKEIAFGKED